MAKQRKKPKAVKLRTGLMTKLLIVILLAALVCEVYALREKVSAAEAEREQVAAEVDAATADDVRRVLSSFRLSVCYTLTKEAGADA